MSTFVVDEVVEQLKSLPYELQWRVLEFARALVLTMPRGVAGTQLLQFAGAISSTDLRVMEKAIEDGCEQVDLHEW